MEIHLPGMLYEDHNHPTTLSPLYILMELMDHVIWDGLFYATAFIKDVVYVRASKIIISVNVSL